MYRHLRLATCASLILFGAVVAGGGIAVAPSLVERLAVRVPEVSRAPGCANGEVASKRGDCMSWHEARVGTDVQPIEAAQAQASSALDKERGSPKQAATVPDRAIESPELAAPVSAVPLPSLKLSPPVQPPEVATPVHETTPQPSRAEERMRAQPAHETTKPRVSALKRTARRARTAERRTHKALAAIRRFEDSRRDIPMNAYAAEGPPRRIIIRPTSIQDVYYYSARPRE
ncbi:MAG TPA: hypothetical protein VH678_20280 [Xanthobacteraceae bacterium]